MILKEGMLVKPFKGKNLIEKNIYQILKLNANGKEILKNENITYTGDEDCIHSNDLVVYANIFQNNRLFAREYSDLIQPLSIDKQKIYNQIYRVEPLTSADLELIKNSDFVETKKNYQKSKIKN